MSNLPSRTAVFKYSLRLPSFPDGPFEGKEPVKWNFARTVNLCASDGELKKFAKEELLHWLDRHLEIEVETKLNGSIPELATAYEERMRGAAAIVANALYFADSSDFSSALRRALRTLNPTALERLEDGSYKPDDLGDEPTGP